MVRRLLVAENKEEEGPPDMTRGFAAAALLTEKATYSKATQFASSSRFLYCSQEFKKKKETGFGSTLQVSGKTYATSEG
jgi:hypothetical protein